MTTDQPSAQRILRRRSDDRVIGGVASGIGEYLNVDPLLVRIAFVALIVFGGLGFLLYVLAWAFVPDEETSDSIVVQAFSRLRFSFRETVLVALVVFAALFAFAGGYWLAVIGALMVIVLGVALLREDDRRWLTTRRFLLGALLVMGAILLIGGVTSGFAYGPIATVAGAGLVVVVLGSFLLRRDDVERGTRAASAAAARTNEAPRRERAVRHRAPKVRSPLGWYVLGAILVAVGALALVTNVSGADVDLGQYFGIGLGVLGVGLVIGTWWGRARRLIMPGLFVLPLAVASSFVTAPIQGGFGEHEYRPANASELRDVYRLIGGRMVVDLSDVTAIGDPIVIGVSVAFGQLKLVLPEDSTIELDADVGAGELGVLGTWQTGTGLADRYVRDGSGPRFILDVEMGVGSAWVDGGPSEGR